VDGTGVGLDAIVSIIRHVFATKLRCQPAWDNWSWEDTIVVPFVCTIGPWGEDSSFAELQPSTAADIHPEFAATEEPERLRCIEEYRSRILLGEDLGRPLYVTGTLLNRLGGETPAGTMYLIDGARRIAASALAHRPTLDAWVLMHESELPRCAERSAVEALQRDVASLEWFENYQSMPIVGLHGERTLNRFQLMDLTRFRDHSVMDFGCNIGQACVKAIQSGASRVVGVEGMRDTFGIAERIRGMVGFENLHYLNVDFNSPEFERRIEESFPGQVDYTFFFSVYRTKELMQRDRLFQYVIDKSRLGIFFEGHAHPKIDTVEYYDWLFESFGLGYEFLGYSEGELRPLFFLPTESRSRGAAQQREARSGRTALSTDEYLAAGRRALPDASGGYLVSAIVSTYASERFIEGRLRDLLEQTIGDRLEIVVIDSGSPENERAVVESYAARHPNIVYVRTDQRETVYQAWNRGIRMARGRYITNANTDDRLRPEAIAILAGILEADRECAVAYGDFYITGYENQTFGRHIRTGYSTKPDFDPSLMLSGCHMGPQPMWRRSLHDEFGYFDERLNAAGDYEFWCRVATRYDMLHIPEFLGLYLHNPAGICNSDTSAVSRECASVQQAYRDRLPASAEGAAPTGYYWKERVRDGRYVNICMVSYNRLKYTKQAIESLLRWTRFPHVISVVDNGSVDGTREYLLEQKRRGVIRNLILLDENVGVAKASNMAWEMEPEAEYYLKYDNDILMKKDGWLADMIRVVDGIPDIGVLGYNFESESYELSEVSGLPVRIKTKGNIGGACTLIPQRTRNLLGCWCEDYGLYGEEDSDYGHRVTESGLWNAYMADEETPFHLPAGKAASINPQTMAAKDGKEEVEDREYRLWKDEQRRKNTDPRSTYVGNCLAYDNGFRSLLSYPRTGSKAVSILGISLREQVRRDPVLANRILEINRSLDGLCFGEALRLARESFSPCDATDQLLEALERVAANEPLAPPRVSIIIPASSNAIVECLVWLERHTLYTQAELVVVDDGAPQKVLQYLSSLSVKVVHNDQSRGFVAACNRGSEIAGGEYLAFLDASTIPQPQWLGELVRSLLTRPGAGIAGSQLIPPQRDTSNRDLPGMSPGAFLVSKALFRDVGALDPSLEPRPALADLCARLRHRNLEVRYVPESLILLRNTPQAPRSS
jgi:GT2 family glycosyltransferase